MRKIAFTLLYCLLMSIGVFAQQGTNPGFQSKDMQLDLPVGHVAGTLLLPAGKGPFPVALIIAGTGPTDRNGNQPMMQTNCYKLMAEELARQGIASLRYDKRGIGASKVSQKEQDLRFDDFVADARMWTEKLKADKAFSKVYVIGHSEGSLIGMLAAAQGKADGFVSVAGIASSADVVLKEQLKAAMPPAYLDESMRVLESLKAGQTVDGVNPDLAMLFRSSVQPYMISWFKYEPSQEISKLNMPVLVVQGTTDIQVPVEQANALAAANKQAKLAVIDQMNHVLKRAEADRQKNIATYNNPDLPLKEEFVPTVAGFIKANSGRR